MLGYRVQAVLRAILVNVKANYPNRHAATQIQDAALAADYPAYDVSGPRRNLIRGWVAPVISAVATVSRHLARWVARAVRVQSADRYCAPSVFGVRTCAAHKAIWRHPAVAHPALAIFVALDQRAIVMRRRVKFIGPLELSLGRHFGYHPEYSLRGI